MTVKPLTKQQKLDIVSKAIDAGAHVNLYFHLGYMDDKVNPVEAYALLDEMTPERIGNKAVKFNDGTDTMEFEATIFVPESFDIPKEWQDTGDMEEADA